MEAGYKSPNRRNDNACGKFCATLCGIFFAIILGLITIGAVYGANYPTKHPVPTSLMDNQCYFTFLAGNIAHEKFEQHASDNIIEDTVNNIDHKFEGAIYEKVLNRQKYLRNHFYFVDPFVVYGILYVAFPIVYILARCCVCCINGCEAIIGDLMFIIYIGMHFCYQFATYIPLNEEKCEAAIRASLISI